MLDLAPYRKGLIAAGGLLLQILTLLDQASQLGILPAEWVPWVQLGVAAATAYGVYRVKNTPLPAARTSWSDRGGSRVGDALALSAAALLILASILFGASSADAHRRPPRPPAPVPVERVLQLRTASVCDGVIWVTFDQHDRAGAILQDDGKVAVRFHFTGGREGPDGQFRVVPVQRRSESRLGVDQRVSDLPPWDAVDLVRVDDPRSHSASMSVASACAL